MDQRWAAARCGSFFSGAESAVNAAIYAPEKNWRQSTVPPGVVGASAAGDTRGLDSGVWEHKLKCFVS